MIRFMAYYYLEPIEIGLRFYHIIKDVFMLRMFLIDNKDHLTYHGEFRQSLGLFNNGLLSSETTIEGRKLNLLSSTVSTTKYWNRDGTVLNKHIYTNGQITEHTNHKISND